MPSFIYRAVDNTGRTIDGSLDGESEAQVLSALERRELTPLTMRRASSQANAERGMASRSPIRLGMPQLLQFTREIKIMLATGLTLLSALAMLHKRAKGAYRRLLECISADIQRGATLSDALASHPKTFDPFYVGTVRAGEAAGIHTEALDELVKFYDRRRLLRREVVSALLYPAIVLVTVCGACVVMLVWVVPQFESTFLSAGAELPLPTQVLLGASRVVTQNWPILAGSFAAAVIAAICGRNWPAARRFWMRAVAALPFIGQVIYLATVIQFARMVALLERSGLPLLETLKVVEDMLIPGPVRVLAGEIRRQVMGGASISSAIGDSKSLPDVMVSAIAVGEATGTIDQTLAQTAEHFEEELRIRIKRMTVALEPILTLLVTALVFGMALAIFLPLWEMNTLMLKH